MKNGYFDWTETMETYEVVVRLSDFHKATVIDIRAQDYIQQEGNNEKKSADSVPFLRNYSQCFC